MSAKRFCSKCGTKMELVVNNRGTGKFYSSTGEEYTMSIWKCPLYTQGGDHDRDIETLDHVARYRELLGETINGEINKRIVERYLFLPLALRGEMRWLCKSKIVQVYDCIGITDDLMGRIMGWCDTEFSEQ